MENNDQAGMDRRNFIKTAAAAAAVYCVQSSTFAKGAMAMIADAPKFTLEKLPYAENALMPYISAKTLSFHYGKHHAGYADKLSTLVVGTEFEKDSLEAIMAKTAGQLDRAAIFNNAAQVWNHTFYWKSLRASGTGTLAGKVKSKIDQDFGGYQNFKKLFSEAAVGQFGSGWVWLVEDAGTLKIVKTANADNPLVHGQKPLLTLDVWEHAYYLDYQNRRPAYADAVVEHLLNWEFAEKNLSA